MLGLNDLCSLILLNPDQGFQRLLGQGRHLCTYCLIYAFNPMITGFPSIATSVSLSPHVLATTRAFPDVLSVGVSRSAVMIFFVFDF
jgi:hypothetical protein